MSLDDLLPPGSLRDTRLAVSVSDSPDLQVLGLDEYHVRLTLAEVSRAVFIAGGTIAYGGRLGPGNYTALLLNEAQRYGGATALDIYLSWHGHRERPLDQVLDADRGLAGHGRIHCLGSDGGDVDPRGERGDGPADASNVNGASALTAMRRRMTDDTTARLVVGGRIDDYEGHMPGVLEETLLAVEVAKPTYVAGGFGGAAALAAKVLNIDNQDWAPPSWSTREYREDLHAPLDSLAVAGGVRPLANGLDQEEQLQLAASHRPSEIAALVVRGLGRMAGKR